jgi:TusA-related sulfurtransferase
MMDSGKLSIDALGMRCPRPIVELAKARRRAEPATVIEITADDLAFESDVRAWCEATESALLELTRTGDLVRAVIRLPKEKAA